MMAKTKRKGWSPEAKAAASERAKARFAGGTATAPPPEATNGHPATPVFEQRPRKFVRPKDGFHYVLVEKSPTRNREDDYYQGDKLYEDGYDLVPDQGSKRFDVYRISQELYDKRRKAKMLASHKGTVENADVSLASEGMRVTQNTASESKSTPKEIFGDAPESE